MSAVDDLIANLQAYRSSSDATQVVCDVDLLIAALQQLQSGGGATGANPTATASDVVVNGVAATFMRSDAAPAVQKATAAQFGIIKPDNVSITLTAGGLLQSVATGNWNLPVTLVGAPTNFTLKNAPTFSTSELLIQNNAASNNVLALQNTNANSFSAVTFRGDDNLEHGAVGWGNSGVGAFPYTLSVYIETSNFNGVSFNSTPPDFKIIQTGTLAAQAAARYLRTDYKGNGDIVNYAPNGTDPICTINTLTKCHSNTSEGNSLEVQSDHVHGYSTIVFQNSASASKLFVGYGNASTTNFANLAYIMPNQIDLQLATFDGVNVNVLAFLDNANKYFGLTPKTPASSAASGKAGDISVDANFIYVCTAANTWKRAALSTF